MYAARFPPGIAAIITWLSQRGSNGGTSSNRVWKLVP
jgi:hypothetical protein